MSTNPECERARMALMASLDEQGDLRSAPDLTHTATCSSCQRWAEELQMVTARLKTLPYQDGPTDLWTAVKSQISQVDQGPFARRLWLIGGAVLGWRALQLSIDLPLPLLHPLVPLAAALVALWQIAGNPLAIATSAPELGKRGI